MLSTLQGSSMSVGLLQYWTTNSWQCLNDVIKLIDLQIVSRQWYSYAASSLAGEWTDMSNLVHTLAAFTASTYGTL